MFAALKEIVNKEKLWFLVFPWQPGPFPERDRDALPVAGLSALSGEGQCDKSLALMWVLQFVTTWRSVFANSVILNPRLRTVWKYVLKMIVTREEHIATECFRVLHSGPEEAAEERGQNQRPVSPLFVIHFMPAQLSYQ